MMRVPQSSDDLRKHLREHMGFIRASSASYDRGFMDEAKRLAAEIRVLVHDTSKSISLLTLLERKDLKYYDTALPDYADNPLPYCGLAASAIGPGGAKYSPHLDVRIPGHPVTVGPFNYWWGKTVLRDNKRNLFARKDIVLAVANKDGGAHVDPTLNEDYAALSRNNSMNWDFVNFEGKREPLGIGPELASVRQIAHELEKTATEQLADLLRD